MSAQDKLEKKIMDEKIAKVREVVRQCNKNHIVLVLHHFDLDVEKTIQAFLQGTYVEALDDWETRGGGASKKSKKNKGKSGNNANGGGGAKASTESVSSGKSTPSVAKSNGYAPAASDASQSPAGVASNAPRKDESANGAPAPVMTATAAKKAKKAKQQQLQQQQQLGEGAVSAAPPPPTTAAVGGGVPSPRAIGVSSDELAKFYALDDGAQLNAISAEAVQLSTYVPELDDLEKAFTTQISLSQTNMMQCFLEIKQRLSERERQLAVELARCRDDAAALFNARRSQLIELSGKTSGAVRSAAERDALYEQLKNFNLAKEFDKHTAYATRFHAESAKLVEAIAHFGKVLPIMPAAATSAMTPHRNDAPVSVALLPNGGSENFSAPNDKENNRRQNGVHLQAESVNNANEPQPKQQQKSQQFDDVPSAKPKPAAAKKISQVNTGGIVMQSDGLSADQLADIQKRLEETLRAQGIDPSVLTEIGSNTVAPRKRQPPGAKNAAGNEKRGGAGAKSNGKNNDGGHSKPRTTAAAV